MDCPAASSGVSTASLTCHAGLDPESSILFWTPAGVYPDENRGRSDDRRGKPRRMDSYGFKMTGHSFQKGERINGLIVSPDFEMEMGT